MSVSAIKVVNLINNHLPPLSKDDIKKMAEETKDLSHSKLKTINEKLFRGIVEDPMVVRVCKKESGRTIANF